MVNINVLSQYIQQLLNVDGFKDYCPNGLQVEGRKAILKIVTGVTANLALLKAAKQAEADLILVHHGYFWRDEDPRLIGIKRNRIAYLLEHNINLMAYHLPLDGHAIYGNNAQLGKVLGILPQPYKAERNFVAYGRLIKPMRLGEFSQHIENTLQRTPMVIGDLNKMVQKVAWCTGAAQSYFESIDAGEADVYISGEISEQTTHQSVETGLSYISAGHHATERYGVQALGNHLAEKFGISHAFIDVDNPV